MKRSSWLVGMMMLAMFAGAALAQPGGGRGGPGGGFGGFGTSPIDLLGREDVQKELELLPDQDEQIQEIRNSARDWMRNAFGEMRDVPREERREKFTKLLQESRDETQKKLDKVLLPHQAKRLKQLAVQMQTRGGVSRALLGGSLAEELDITDSQKEKLQKKAEELEAEMRDKLAKLRDEARKELLGVLSPAQQKKFEEMVGDSFEFQQSRGFGGRGPGGDRGGPGGDRGGRGGGDRGGRPERPDA